MPQIGKFIRMQSGFSGRIQTLTFVRDIVIAAAEASDAESAPDYRVHIAASEGTELLQEIGAAWKRTGERAGDYIAVVIDDPALPQPIRANLFCDRDTGNEWFLHWTRPVKRDAKD